MNHHLIGALAATAVVVAGAALRPGPWRLANPAALLHSARPPHPPRHPQLWPRTVLVRRATARDVLQSFPDALDAIVLAVRAGYLPSAAMTAVLPYVAPVLRAAFVEVLARTQAGERFADALAALPAQLGPIASPLADSFAAADRDGLPLAPVLERLAEEARQRRRRQADSLTRQLPVRMSLPLVLCILPSFVFLAIVPLLLAALSSLHQ